MNKVKFGELDFNGDFIQLTQSSGFDIMINATEMWKSFGKLPNKRPIDWLKQIGTIEYLNCIKSEVSESHFTPVITIKG